jgi:hypothetical protein
VNEAWAVTAITSVRLSVSQTSLILAELRSKVTNHQVIMHPEQHSTLEPVHHTYVQQQAMRSCKWVGGGGSH